MPDAKLGPNSADNTCYDSAVCFAIQSYSSSFLCCFWSNKSRVVPMFVFLNEDIWSSLFFSIQIILDLRTHQLLSDDDLASRTADVFVMRQSPMVSEIAPVGSVHGQLKPKPTQAYLANTTWTTNGNRNASGANILVSLHSCADIPLSRLVKHQRQTIWT